METLRNCPLKTISGNDKLPDKKTLEKIQKCYHSDFDYVDPFIDAYIDNFAYPYAIYNAILDKFLLEMKYGRWDQKPFSIRIYLNLDFSFYSKSSYFTYEANPGKGLLDNLIDCASRLFCDETICDSNHVQTINFEDMQTFCNKVTILDIHKGFARKFNKALEEKGYDMRVRVSTDISKKGNPYIEYKLESIN